MTNTDPQPDGGIAVQHGPSSSKSIQNRNQLWTIARLEYQLAIRNKWALALVGLFTFFSLILATFSGSAVGPDGTERIVVSLTNLAVYLIPLAALAFGYDAIVGRQESGWLATVFALPVSRAAVVIGSYLGRLFVLAGAIIIGFGAVGILLLRDFGPTSWNVFIVFLSTAIGTGAVFLALAYLISSLAREKTHALGVSLLVWVWFILVYDLLTLGLVASFDFPDPMLTGFVLSNPVSIFRVSVLSQVESATAGGFSAAVANTDLSIGLLAISLIFWIIVLIWSASWAIKRRRL